MGSRPLLLIADLRRPGERMAILPLKLSDDALRRLQAQADQLRLNRMALACALLQVVERLEDSIAREVG